MPLEELASVDGEIAPTERTAIPVRDDGLYRGDGVFEVIRLYAGRPFALTEHLDRLERSAGAIELPVEFDFMAVSSYGSSTKSSGVVRILKDLDHEVTGRDVLLVEDIIDSGLTINYLLRYLEARQPATLEICSLFWKRGEQAVPLDVRYPGFEIPPVFVVGYGLDYEERYRNLPYIGVLRESAYREGEPD